MWSTTSAKRKKEERVKDTAEFGRSAVCLVHYLKGTLIKDLDTSSEEKWTEFVKIFVTHL